MEIQARQLELSFEAQRNPPHAISSCMSTSAVPSDQGIQFKTDRRFKILRLRAVIGISAAETRNIPTPPDD
jgi:hypothetical protein